MCQNEVTSTLDRIRLLMIYLISQGAMQISTRKTLMKGVHKKLQQAVINLTRFGIEIQAKEKGESGKTRISEERTKEFIERNNSIKLTLMRYVPLLKSILVSLLKGDLSDEHYPYMSPPPPSDLKDNEPTKRSGDKPRPTARRHADWRKDNKVTEEKEDTRPLLIVFILGGVTFSETRTLYELADHQGANLIIGSCNTITPAEFVRCLCGLKAKPFKKYLTTSENFSRLPSSDDDEDQEDKEYTDMKKNMTTPPKRKEKDKLKNDDENEEIGDDDDTERTDDEEEQFKDDTEDVPITRIHSGGSGNSIAKNRDTDKQSTRSKEKNNDDQIKCCSECIVA